MRNNLRLASVSLFFILAFSLQVAFSQSLSSNELIMHAKQYDGKIITYSGEVIGDVMRRGEFAWVNINDGDNAVGIWIDTALTKEINFTGAYKSRGDTLEITGIFHRACLEHGGDLDIHAQTLHKIASGEIIKQKFNFNKAVLSFILFGVLFLIWILSLFRRK
ncbi:MAG: DNA-binding protein [Candidatus Omnitrophota bacterium]|nr:DNA-binding protein [Candidatus Omnitrophota bacterium]